MVKRRDPYATHRHLYHRFAGDADAVVALRRMPGLEPDEDNHARKMTAHARAERRVVQAVVGFAGSPLVGQTIKSLRFRSRFDAVVIIAVHICRLLVVE